MRGRKRSQTRSVVINIKLYLVPGCDDDLIAFFQGCQFKQRAKMVQAALRGGNFIGQANDDLADEEIINAFDERIF